LNAPDDPLEIAEGVNWIGVIDWRLLFKDMLEAPVFAPGSPTMHNSIFFTLGGFLTYLRGLHP